MQTLPYKSFNIISIKFYQNDERRYFEVHDTKIQNGEFT